jgi:hypothetical protein
LYRVSLAQDRHYAHQTGIKSATPVEKLSRQAS